MTFELTFVDIWTYRLFYIRKSTILGHFILQRSSQMLWLTVDDDQSALMNWPWWKHEVVWKCMFARLYAVLYVPRLMLCKYIWQQLTSLRARHWRWWLNMVLLVRHWWDPPNHTLLSVNYNESDGVVSELLSRLCCMLHHRSHRGSTRNSLNNEWTACHVCSRCCKIVFQNNYNFQRMQILFVEREEAG